MKKLILTISFAFTVLFANAQLKVLSTGETGIGISTPGYKLHSYGSDAAFDNNGDVRLYINHNTSSNVGSIIFTTGGPGTANGWAEIGLTGDNNLHFKSNASAGAYTDRLTILGASGNVGIGTTTPANPLQVKGGTLTTGTTSSYSFSTGNSNANDFTIGSDGSYTYLQSWNSKPLKINNQGNNTLLNPSSGRVGIGTTTPISILDVEGGISIGSTYSGTTAAPTNGAIIEGSVGIGTTTPASKLDVEGGISIGSTYSGTAAAPTNGAIIQGNVGIGTSSPGYTLDISGTAHCTASAWSSDQQFKTDIDTVRDAISIINQLKPKTYYFDTLNANGIVFPAAKQYGFIAQDLEKVLPELVTSVTKATDVDTSGTVIHAGITYKAVYYIGLIGILTKGMQELSSTIDSLKEVTALQNEQLNACCSANKTAPINGNNNGTNESFNTGIKGEGATINGAVLYQNNPNPFSTRTQIGYYLPAECNSCFIYIFDMNGKLLKSYPITQKGKGALEISGSEFEPGMYIYSLVANNTEVDTKKMILTK